MDSQQETLKITDKLRRLIRSKARRVVGKAGLTNSDCSDVEQELWLDLLERWPKFEADRASAGTFINHVLNHKVAMILRERQAAKRIPLHGGRSLDVQCRDEDGEVVTKAMLLDEHVHRRRTGQATPSTFELLGLKLDTSSVLSTLPTQQRCLCEDMKYFSIMEIARTSTLTRTIIYQTIYRLRTRFKELGMNAYHEKKCVQLSDERSKYINRSPLHDAISQA